MEVMTIRNRKECPLDYTTYRPVGTGLLTWCGEIAGTGSTGPSWSPIDSKDSEFLLRILTQEAITPAPCKEADTLPSKQIVEIKETLGLTMREVANLLQVTTVTIYEWLKGGTGISTKNLKLIKILYTLVRNWHKVSEGKVPGWLRVTDSWHRLISSIKSGATEEEITDYFASVVGDFKQAIANVPNRTLTRRPALPREVYENNVRLQVGFTRDPWGSKE